MKIAKFTLMLALSLTACAKDPFSTRGTEAPLGTGGTWETPQAPEVVVRNLLFAYNERVISNYELCLSDSFKFSSPEDSIDALNNGRAELYSDWNQQVEIASTSNIFHTFSGSDTMNLFLIMAASPGHGDLLEDSLAILYRNYTITIIEEHAGISDTVTASGQATFHLRQEQLNWWTIYWWEDLPVSTNAMDWGDFKAEYRR
jgi:hypothetical protein